MIIVLTSAVVAGSNDASGEFSCGESAFTISEVRSVKAECVRLILSLKLLDKELHSDLIYAWVGREGAGRLWPV